MSPGDALDAPRSRFAVAGGSAGAGGIAVAGRATGLRARLDDLEALAALLTRRAADLLGWSVVAGEASTDPVLPLTVPAAPATGVAAELRLVDAAGRLALGAARLEACAQAARLAAWTYRALDQQLAAMAAGAAGAVGLVVAPPVPAAAGAVVVAGRSIGLFVDATGHTLSSGGVARTRAPSGLEDLLVRLDAVGASDVDGDGVRDDGGRLEIIETPGPVGGRRWVVLIPGTQSWDPRPGDYLGDVTADLVAMSGRQTEYERAIAHAMTEAGIAPGEPVMLVGHSLGGIAAADLVADPELRQRFAVTHVVTVGSPVDRVPVPPGVRALALQNADDVVPRLDGIPVRDDPRRVTVTFAVAEVRVEPARAHDLATYRPGAGTLDRCDEPRVRDFLDSAGDFLSAERALAHRYRVLRSNG